MQSPLRLELLEARNLLSTFLVSNLRDSGPGSLRQAILDANAHSGYDRIAFNLAGQYVRVRTLPGTGPGVAADGTVPVATIHPATPLPALTDQVFLSASNAFALPGSPTPFYRPTVELDGSQSGNAPGLVVAASGCTVQGLIINRFALEGIYLTSAGSRTLITGCYLGTDASGLRDRGNGRAGVFVQGASNNTIQQNVISGNQGHGLGFANSMGNSVTANLIGTDARRLTVLGNDAMGVNFFDSSNSTVGGSNLIAANRLGGGRISGSSQHVTIRGNAIYANGGLNLDLGGDGTTPNDAGDADSGPNGLQNCPVLSAYLDSISGSKVSVRLAGALAGPAGARLTVDYYATPLTRPEGRIYLGAQTVQVGTGGTVEFMTIFRGLPSGMRFTATATSAAGDTSEFSPAAVLQPIAGPLITYKDFGGQSHTLQVWEGYHLAFLTPRGLSPSVMVRIVSTFDRAYDFYQSMTGRTPISYGPTTYHGKSTIAVVNQTCGAGCGYVGFTGIEIMPDYFNNLYLGVQQRSTYSQVLFYELGRNFWFYSGKIEYHGNDNQGTITTGYAVFMRYLSMEYAGVLGDPDRGVTFPQFRQEVISLVDRYTANPALNWGNTLAIHKAPPNPINLEGTDLFASFLYRLRSWYGGNTFIRRLWAEVIALPDATTTQGAIDNFVTAASRAASRNLARLFTQTWRWPVSATTQSQLAREFP